MCVGRASSRDASTPASAAARRPLNWNILTVNAANAEPDANALFVRLADEFLNQLSKLTIRDLDALAPGRYLP